MRNSEALEVNNHGDLRGVCSPQRGDASDHTLLTYFTHVFGFVFVFLFIFLIMRIILMRHVVHNVYKVNVHIK